MFPCLFNIFRLFSGHSRPAVVAFYVLYHSQTLSVGQRGCFNFFLREPRKFFKLYNSCSFYQSIIYCEWECFNFILYRLLILRLIIAATQFFIVNSNVHICQAILSYLLFLFLCIYYVLIWIPMFSYGNASIFVIHRASLLQCSQSRDCSEHVVLDKTRRNTPSESVWFLFFPPPPSGGSVPHQWAPSAWGRWRKGTGSRRCVQCDVATLPSTSPGIKMADPSLTLCGEEHQGPWVNFRAMMSRRCHSMVKV